MQNFSAVIFDMDGLLLDSERLSLQAFNETCDKFGLGDLSAIFKQCIGTNPELGATILQNGFQGIMDDQEFNKAWQANYTMLTEGKPVPVKRGVVQFLDYASSLSMPMAVATSTVSETAKRKLSSSDLLKYFPIIIGGDQVAKSKPDPDIYLKAASALSVDPARCLALEDSANGVKAAVSAGMTVVQIPDLVEPDEQLLKLGHIVVSCFDDLLNYKF